MASKDKPAIVSGAGWIGDFAGKLVNGLIERGCSLEQIHSLVTSEGKIAMGKFIDGVAEYLRNAGNLFRLVVDYNQSLAEMIVRGKYDWVNFDISEKHFPVARRGTDELELQLVHLNRAVSSDEVLRELEKLGLRPATLPELLAFGAAYKEEQRKYPIVALGSVWLGGFGRRDVAYLCGGASERYLDLDWFGHDWGLGWRFAAVRK